MHLEELARPSQVACPSGFVVKKGLKMRASDEGVVPTSRTLRPRGLQALEDESVCRSADMRDLTCAPCMDSAGSLPIKITACSGGTSAEG